jgi:hypothetical protein
MAAAYGMPYSLLILFDLHLNKKLPAKSSPAQYFTVMLHTKIKTFRLMASPLLLDLGGSLEGVQHYLVSNPHFHLLFRQMAACDV